VSHPVDDGGSQRRVEGQALGLGTLLEQVPDRGWEPDGARLGRPGLRALPGSPRPNVDDALRGAPSRIRVAPDPCGREVDFGDLAERRPRRFPGLNDLLHIVSSRARSLCVR